MLEGLEFVVIALLAVAIFWLTSNTLILLAMYYTRKVLLIVVRDHLI